MTNLNIVDNKIIVDTDDPTFGSLFKYSYMRTDYNTRMKSGWTHRVHETVYDESYRMGSSTRYVFKLGWGILIMNMFHDKLGVDNIEKIRKSIMSDTYRTYPFSNLRPFQNDDVLHTLKYKYGLFSCYTSYGKTEVIATLIRYLYNETDMNIMILVPSKKCRDELVKRCALDRFGINIPSEDGRIDLIVTNGVSASKKYRTEEGRQERASYLSKFDCLIADEVEYTLSAGGKMVMDMCKNTKIRYGFSGTADKLRGRMITFAEGLSDVIKDNKDLVGYYGQALIFRLATHLSVNLVTINTSAFSNVKFYEGEISSSSGSYLKVLKKMWTDDRVCRFIGRVINQYPKLFIPVNNLQNIINNWIERYWIGRYRVLLISGAGYTYYGLDGSVSRLTLNEACDKINNNEVDVIPSTSAGYRALDLPSLTNILLIQGKIGGVVLQSVGRVARGTETNIIVLKPTTTRIPIYSKGIESRFDMIKGYYSQCSINNVERYEIEF